MFIFTINLNTISCVHCELNEELERRVTETGLLTKQPLYVVNFSSNYWNETFERSNFVFDCKLQLNLSYLHIYIYTFVVF